MSDKPTQEQAVAALENLHSNMHTTALIIGRYSPQGHSHAQELLGAADMVNDWIEAVKAGTK